MQPCWSFRNEISIMDGTAMKDRGITTCSTARHSTKTVTPKSHRHRRYKAAGKWVYILGQHECQYRRNNTKLAHMPQFPGNMAKRKNDFTWNTRESVETHILTINNNYVR